MLVFIKNMTLTQSRPLEMLNLINQFKKYIKKRKGIIFMIPFLFSAYPSKAETRYYAFKVLEKVYSLSDIQVLNEQRQYLKCSMFGELKFEKLLNFKNFNDKEFEKEFKIAKGKKSNNPKIEAYLNQSILVIKLLLTMKKYDLTLNKSLQRSILKAIKENKCGDLGYVDGYKSEMRSWFKNYIKIEIYFNTKFALQQYIVSELEIKSDMKKKGISFNKAKNSILQSRKRNAINIFLKSIVRQISHESFW
jgi:hypothetical protein